MQDEISDVLRLIAQPLDNVSKLIKGENKFVVQSNLLHQFNTVLDIVENKPSDIIIYHIDRKTLESFEKLLNNIPKLVVTQRSIHSHNNFIDVRRFKKLRHLELIRVPLDKVKGLNVLKPQLEFFFCNHCSNVEIITKSGKLQWSELVNIKLKNSPVNLDEHFFVSMPWIQHLDLSFANLRKIDALHCLDNLKFLNLSFNHLQHMPTLSSAACTHLQVLLINHNYLEDLDGLQWLINLRGLDLSWNWIAEKRTLSPLLNLKNLQWINMSSTPLSFNKYYRLYLASAIGSSAAKHQFVIDNKGLNIKEQGVLGSGLGIIRCGRTMYTSENVNSHESTTSRCSSNTTTINSAGPVITGTKNRTGPKKKSSKVREVVISDFSENQPQGGAFKYDEEVIKEESMEKESPLETETKNNDNIKNNTEQILMDSSLHEAIISEQLLAIENQNEVITEIKENKEIDQSEVSNITLGLLEVEIHDSKYRELNQYDDNPIESVVENNQIIVPSQEESNGNETSQISSSELPIKSDVQDQSIDEIKQECDNISEEGETSQHEQLMADTNNANEKQEQFNNNNEQLDEINHSSAESQQDDQDYYSATEDRDRSKTFSSIDSGDVSQSPDIEDSLDTNQEGQNYISTLEESSDKNLTISPVDTPVNLSPNTKETTAKDDTMMEIDPDSDSDSSNSSDVEDEMWPVQIVNNKTKSMQNILLLLSENEIKERSPLSGRTVTRWSFDSVQSCIKTKNEPFTVELEFDADKTDKQSRTYVMEFSDAQVLIKRMYNILESRPLSAMNQSIYKCLKCDSIFVQSASKVKEFQVRCTVCSSVSVSLMDEPRPPEVKSLPNKSMSQSPSQSSIALVGDKDGNGSSTASTTSKISCSAASLDQGPKTIPRSGGAITPKKYESDIEIISNPSQSSIEVLDEYSRSQGSTPCRKRSSEERQIVAVPQLCTVLEVNAQLSALTESSSSGSLTESVITTYESHNVINKKPKPEECLIEESREGSPVTELTTNTAQGLFEENGNLSQNNPIINYTDIYNYSDFAEVDVRIKLFLYQSIFHDENEELLLLAKCHIWKTGGVDYDACVVFSTTKLYFLSHSLTKFQEDNCDWLTLNDTYLLKEVKQISPLIWHQGAILNINNITCLILLLDKERTNNFFKYIEGLSLKGIKIKPSFNSKYEMSLQQAVLSSGIRHEAVVPSITSFSICLRICINRDDEEEIMRLGGLVITGSEFHLVPGDLNWLCSDVVPSIHISQKIANLIEVEQTESTIKFHFLDEEDAIEEIWTIKLATSGEISSIISTIKTIWEYFFLVPLEVAVK